MKTTDTGNEEQLREAIRQRYTNSVQSLLNEPKSPPQEARPELIRVTADVEANTQANACCGSDCCTPAAGASPELINSAPQPLATQASGCCGSDCCSDPITGALYSDEELAGLPLTAALASRGCGNPTALAELKAGERVLDLGSGGGIDVLLSAKRVGPTGFAYGLDMTDAMLEIAERNRRSAGVENVQFLKGEIEQIPLPDAQVDVVISNCVINLAADKSKVLREAYRVLKSGGRFAVSDITFQGQFPPALRSDLESWAGCIAGALEEETYRNLLGEAGFEAIEVEVTRRYSLEDVAESGGRASLELLPAAERASLDGKFVSAFIRARKP